MMWWLLSTLLTGAPPESLAGVSYRAVTFEPNERRLFRVPQMERVTGASGNCIEEILDAGETETLTLQSSCAGLRTAMVWRHDGSRVHLMVCAEDAERQASLVKTRKSVQQALAATKLKSATACVRNGRVELWGWVATPEEKKQLDAVQKRFGEVVANRVELVDAEMAQ